MEWWKCTLEGLGLNLEFWRNRSVFITGHTGFKGGWLSLWLSNLGANVYGFSLPPPTKINFYREVNLASRLSGSVIGDIRNLSDLVDSITVAKPSVIFHMAAQSLVRESYKSPVETFSTNVIGTVHLLEAARRINSVQAIVNVTSDKCYENQEWVWPYREIDGLGGNDPYSASKACADIAASAYRNSFLRQARINMANARAGNVIGGGDWAVDRLIPDCFRALDSGASLRVRSPNAVRPWQHVLEPLYGYIKLAESLVTVNDEYSESWNFGPDEIDAKSVIWILERMRSKKPSLNWEIEDVLQQSEAGVLKVDSAKAKSRLGWFPRWTLETSLYKTIEWHSHWLEKKSMADYSIQQIEDYLAS